MPLSVFSFHCAKSHCEDWAELSWALLPAGLEQSPRAPRAPSCQCSCWFNQWPARCHSLKGQGKWIPSPARKKSLIALKWWGKGHSISCLSTTTASKSVSWPSLPLTHIHQFTSWRDTATPKPLQWLPIAQDEIKHGLQSYPWPEPPLSGLTVPCAKPPASYKKTVHRDSISVQALFLGWRPSTQVPHQAPVPPSQCKRWATEC